jgi:hypothetical protein
MRAMQPSDHPAVPENGGGAPTISRAQTAHDAGLSRDQKWMALRVANMPAAEFETAPVRAAGPAEVRSRGPAIRAEECRFSCE